MPHLHGPLRRAAVVATLLPAQMADAPDTIDEVASPSGGG
jgi:hypothetical protein